MVKKFSIYLLFFIIIFLQFLALLSTNAISRNYSLGNIQNNKLYSNKLFPEPFQYQLVDKIQAIDTKNEMFDIPNSSNLILEYKKEYENEVINSLEGIGGKVKRQYYFDYQLAIYVPIGNLTLLKKICGITNIWKDRIFHAYLDTSVPIIKPPAQWSQIEAYFGTKINGTGIKIAVLDTGVDGNHWDLWPRVIHNVTYVSGESWMDLHGHGTHISGIIAGNGNRSAGQYTGMAPAAEIMNFKVLNQNAVGYESDILAAMEDAVTNGSDIINLSFGTKESSNGTDPYSMKVKWAVEQGIPVIIASGINTGSYNVSCPGTCPFGITVGATTDLDALFGTQPKGPTLGPSYDLKPDVMAPGEFIISCRAAGTNWGVQFGLYYTRESGSSMAAAHVSGMVALIKQIHPEWSPQTIKNALMNNAIDLGQEIFSQGAGRIRGPESINATVVADGSINFGTVGANRSKLLDLKITNLENSPKTITLNHSNFDYKSVILVSLPSLNTVTVSINLTPSSFTSHHNFDIFNFNWGTGSIHSIITSIYPNLTIITPDSIKYGNNVNFTGFFAIDNAIEFNYSNYIAKLYLNSTLETMNTLNSSGYIYLNYSSFQRGNYNVSIAIFDQYNNYIHQNDMTINSQGKDINIFGLGSVEQGKIGFIYFESNDMDIGQGTFNIYVLTYAWVKWGSLIPVNNQGYLIVPGILLPNIYAIKIEFLGSEKSNPAIGYSTLIVLPNSNSQDQTRLIIITVAVTIIIVLLFTFIYYTDKKREKTYKFTSKKLNKKDAVKLARRNKLQDKIRSKSYYLMATLGKYGTFKPDEIIILNFVQLLFSLKELNKIDLEAKKGMNDELLNLINIIFTKKDSIANQFKYICILFEKANHLRINKDVNYKLEYKKIIDFYEKLLKNNTSFIYSLTETQYLEILKMLYFSYLYINKKGEARKKAKQLLVLYRKAKDYKNHDFWQKKYNELSMQ